MADKAQPEVTRSVRSWGLWSHKFTDAYKAFDKNRSKLVKPQEPGKADMIVTKGRHVCYIEVKDADKSFAFDQFQDNKREWVALMQQDFGSSIWLFLVMGTHPANYNREKYPYARRAWLMPIEVFYFIESIMPQGSLPMIAGRGYSIELQENNLDAVHILAPLELCWKGNKTWGLPKGHLFEYFFEGEALHVNE